MAENNLDFNKKLQPYRPPRPRFELLQDEYKNPTDALLRSSASLTKNCTVLFAAVAILSAVGLLIPSINTTPHEQERMHETSVSGTRLNSSTELNAFISQTLLFLLVLNIKKIYCPIGFPVFNIFQPSAHHETTCNALLNLELRLKYAMSDNQAYRTLEQKTHNHCPKKIPAFS